MGKVILFSMLFVLVLAGIVCSFDETKTVKKGVQSEYYEDNYHEYKLSYDPKVRPYSIVGKKPQNILIYTSGKQGIAIPQFKSKDDYDDFHSPLLVPRYSQDYIKNPFQKRKADTIKVVYAKLKNIPQDSSSFKVVYV
jgi:hypothetical protein